MFSSLPDYTQKRLGDGLYEQRLVRDAIMARTGQRYLAGLTSDEAMYRYLMDNALASKDALQLSLGVSLSAEQVAALTHDIVWLEEHEVLGEKVLVPVLYLAQAEGRLMANGALIQGADVTLISGGDLINQGTLRASNNLNVSAGNDDVPQIILNRQNGVAFERQVVEAFDHVGGVKNTAPVTVQLSNGAQVTTIPDLWGKTSGDCWRSRTSMIFQCLTSCGRRSLMLQRLVSL